ncbi:MAG: helicase associated domain-containing protein [Paraclostridium sp.]
MKKELTEFLETRVFNQRKEKISKDATFKSMTLKDDDSIWQRMYGGVLLYMVENNNILPKGDAISHDGKKIGGWLIRQKMAIRRGELGIKYIKQLSMLPGFMKSIGYKQEQHLDIPCIKYSEQRTNKLPYNKNSASNAEWQKMKNICHGHMSVSHHTEMPHPYAVTSKGIKIGEWAMEQLRLYQSGLLDESRIKELSKIKGWKF